MRGGRIMKISIFDIVVGDVVPLRIGDQVRFIPDEFSFTML
jgi:Ca2+-transporting ATPase